MGKAQGMSLVAASAVGRMTGDVRLMKYGLRCLMVVVVVGPALLAGAWYLSGSGYWAMKSRADAAPFLIAIAIAFAIR